MKTRILFFIVVFVFLEGAGARPFSKEELHKIFDTLQKYTLLFYTPILCIEGESDFKGGDGKVWAETDVKKDSLETIDEMAVILGHELGHLENERVANVLLKASKEATKKMPERAFAGKEQKIVFKQVGLGGKYPNTSGYDDEIYADLRGVTIAHQAGYNVCVAPGMFARWGRKSRHTHPDDTLRAKYVANFIKRKLKVHCEEGS